MNELIDPEALATLAGALDVDSATVGRWLHYGREAERLITAHKIPAEYNDDYTDGWAACIATIEQTS